MLLGHVISSWLPVLPEEMYLKSRLSDLGAQALNLQTLDLWNDWLQMHTNMNPFRPEPWGIYSAIPGSLEGIGNMQGVLSFLKCWLRVGPLGTWEQPAGEKE